MRTRFTLADDGYFRVSFHHGRSSFSSTRLERGPQNVRSDSYFTGPIHEFATTAGANVKKCRPPPVFELASKLTTDLFDRNVTRSDTLLHLMKSKLQIFGLFILTFQLCLHLLLV